MYSKEKIGLLFNQYVDNGDDKTFGELMEAIDPIIDIVLKKYKKKERHFEDVKQDVKMKLWKNQRNPKKLGRYCESPTTYIFYLIRSYVSIAYEKILKIYEDNEKVADSIRSEQWMYGIDETKSER